MPPGTQAPGYRIQVPEYPSIQVVRYPGTTQVPGYQGNDLYPGTWTPGYLGTWNTKVITRDPRCLDTQVSEYLDAQVPRYQGTRLPVPSNHPPANFRMICCNDLKNKGNIGLPKRSPNHSQTLSTIPEHFQNRSNRIPKHFQNLPNTIPKPSQHPIRKHPRPSGRPGGMRAAIK